MKNSKWIRVGAAAAAAFGLVATSSSASAQWGNKQYCRYVASVVCSWGENVQPIDLTIECFVAEYEACMNGYGTFGAKTPGSYDKRRDVQLG